MPATQQCIFCVKHRCLSLLKAPLLKLSLTPSAWITPTAGGRWVEGVSRIMRAWVGPRGSQQGPGKWFACGAKPLNSLHPHWLASTWYNTASHHLVDNACEVAQVYNRCVIAVAARWSTRRVDYSICKLSDDQAHLHPVVYYRKCGSPGSEGSA